MKLLFTTVLILLCLSLNAQFNIKGVVLDQKSNDKIEFASVVLRTLDSKLIAGTKTKKSGAFILKKVPSGNYILTISSLGYGVSKKEIKVNSNKDLGNISIKNKSKTLSAVKIKADKPTIDIQADKKVFNVDQNISAQGGTLEDVLRNVPSITLGADGSVSLRGKSNVTILVDGTRNALFADLETALQSIPADNIESIEVITNPSAKYEAQGLGGIINIVLKANKRKLGLTGSVNLGAKYNWRANAGANLNYRVNDKLAFFLNTNGGIGQVWETNDYSRLSYENNETFRSESIKHRDPKRLFSSFGVEYALSKKSKITWTNSFFRGNFGGNDTTDIYEETDFTTLNQYWFRNNVYTAWPSSNTTNLRFQTSFKEPKQKLKVELNLSDRNYRRISDFQTNIFTSSDSLISSFTQKNPIEGGNVNGAFQVDYEQPLGKKSNIELGERSYVINFKSENFPTIQQLNEEEIEETILKNDFNYLMQVHGLYSTFSTKYKDYAIQIGLRGEYFQYNGTAAQLNSDFSTDYLSLFPSTFITKELDKSSNVTFSYSRRVNRPGFFSLIPFIRVNNPLDTSIGNPALQPEFINAFELSYSKIYNTNNTFLISGYYQLTNDIIQRYRRFNSDGSTFSQSQNLASGTTFGLELTNQFFIRKGWDITLNANGFRNIINGSNIDSTQEFEGYGGFVKLNNNMSIGKLWSFQLNANYYAPKIIVQGTRKGFGFINLALKRSFIEKQLSLTLLANDILNTNQTITEFDLFPTQFQETRRNRQTQFFGFNLRYTFPRKGKTTSFSNYRKGNKGSKKRDDNLKGDDDGGY